MLRNHTYLDLFDIILESEKKKALGCRCAVRGQTGNNLQKSGRIVPSKGPGTLEVPAVCGRGVDCNNEEGFVSSFLSI